MPYSANEMRYSLMKYRKLGNSGLKVPVVSLGFWHNFGSNANLENMKRMCFTAFDNGITYFDLANNYGPTPGSAEENLGKIISSDLKPYRDELLIATKAGYTMWPGPYGDMGSRKYLLSSLDQSLKRLGLDYVDIFYHHRMDPDTPLEESMLALDQAVRSGKALYAGISNYDCETTEKAIKILKELKTPFVVNQIRYNLFDRTIEENGLKEYAAKNGCGLVAFSPLAQGLLTERYLRGIPSDSRIKSDGRFLKEEQITKEYVELIKSLDEIALSRSQTLAQLALSWILKDNDIASVIIGASSPEQIAENARAAFAAPLTDDELKAIEDCLNKKDA